MDKFNKVYENILKENKSAFSSSRFIYEAVNKENKDYYESFTYNNGVITESISFEVEPEKKGGIIVFSVEVNAVKLSNKKFIDWIKKKVETIKNYLFINKKIDAITGRQGVYGCSVGNFCNGRYHAKDGTVFSEKSLSVEIINVTFDELIKIAEEICRDFKQESVLVKDYSNFKICFVDGE